MRQINLSVNPVKKAILQRLINLSMILLVLTSNFSGRVTPVQAAPVSTAYQMPNTYTNTDIHPQAMMNNFAVNNIETGFYFTCVLINNGGVKCWGQNNFGQLGDGTTQQRNIPLDVNGLSNGVTAISLGFYHACALTSNGGVKCWGMNNIGQLGDGTTTQRNTPVDVVGLNSGVTAISTGYGHTCALTTSGGIKCWGYNEYGQLGNGTQLSSNTPIDVDGLTSGVLAISVGGEHSCALTTTGSVKCWGRNLSGQLGDSTQINSSIALDVIGLSNGVTDITSGFNHTCALIINNMAKCWGYNGTSQLGDGTTSQTTIPVIVNGLPSNTTSITTGSVHTCILVSNGTAKCWGSNYNGQLGDGTTINRAAPVNVIGLTDEITAIVAGGTHVCALTMSGGVKCWGDNLYGELGDGTTTQRLTPVNVIGLTGISTATPTASVTNPPTETPTITETPTETLTPFPSETGTETLTPTVTPSITITETVSATETPTETPTPTVSPTMTHPFKPTMTATSGASTPAATSTPINPGEWVDVLPSISPDFNSIEGFEGIWPLSDGLWRVNNVDDPSGYATTCSDNTFCWDDTKYTRTAHTGGWSAWPSRESTYYPPNMDTRMVYGPFDLSDAELGSVTFYQWLDSEPGYDSLALEISLNGTDFYPIQSWSGGTKSWQMAQNTFCTNAAGICDSVWLAWHFTSDDNNWSEPNNPNHSGPWVDDIRIQKWVDSPATPTPTITPTKTSTRTKTRTPTITRTRTKTPTPTKTLTPTITPSPFPLGSDLALRKPITASGFCNTNQTASKAVNGHWRVINDKWCDSTSTNKWLKVDLGAVYTLTRVGIYHAGAGNESSTYNTKNFSIEISEDGITWYTKVIVTKNTQNATVHNIIAKASSPQVKARYVRLNVSVGQQSGGYTARIYELFVYGVPLTPTPTRTNIPTFTPTITKTITVTTTPSLTLTSTPTLPAIPCVQSVPQSGTKTVNVYIVVYTVQGPITTSNPFAPDAAYQSRKYSDCLMQELTNGTKYHGYNNSAATPYLSWKPYLSPSGDSIHIINEEAPDFCPAFLGNTCNVNTPDKHRADIGAIFANIQAHYNADDICTLVQEGKVQEVWLWADDYGNFSESLATGPEYNVGNGGDPVDWRMPNCGKQLLVMGFDFNPHVPMPNTMHAFGHSIEFAADTLFPCEFDVNPEYWSDPDTDTSQRVNSAPKTNGCAGPQGFSARAEQPADISQCGMIHWSPNITWLDEYNNRPLPSQTPHPSHPWLEYWGYHDQTLILNTGCDSWAPNPHILEPTIVANKCNSAGAWGCDGTQVNQIDSDQVKFYRWWMQNIPGPDNDVKRCDGVTLVGNWWDYILGDSPNPDEKNHPEWSCRTAAFPAPKAITGLVQMGQLSRATIRMYTLTPGGVLTPIIFEKEIVTAPDGSYQTPPLPADVDGKTLVVQASGGNFIDEATGQTFSFAGHSLYAVIPAVDLNRPLVGIVTPFSDIAFRLTLNAVEADPNLSPDEQAKFYNFWVSVGFNLGSGHDKTVMPELDAPANLYDGQDHDLDATDTTYALALAGLSQQALDRGISPVDWITELSNDAADGKFDNAANESAQSISSAISEFITGTHSPFPSSITLTATLTPTSPMITLTPTNTHTLTTSTFTSLAMQDGWLLESSENSNKASTLNKTGKFIQLGDDAANRQYRAILSFNTASLPDNAVIISATLKLKQSGASVGTNPFNVLGNLWVDLRKGWFGSSPALQLSDFNATATIAKVATFNKNPISGWYSTNLNISGQNSINKTTQNAGLTQFRLYFAKDDNNNHLADYIKLLSGNNNLPDNKPALIITYILP